MTTTAVPNLYVISGAGLSAESGIPTFRDSDGIWSRFDVNEVCNGLTWKQHREKVFEFYHLMRQTYTAAQPNEAHRLLAKWQSQWGPQRVRLLTQNVDLLLEAAGAQEVTHLHGRLDQLHCTACDTRWAAEINVHARCPKCQSLKGVKPGVVLFHEMAPEYLTLRRMHKQFRAQDVMVFVGTAMEVLSADYLVPSKFHGAPRIVNVNPQRLGSAAIGMHIEAPAGDGLAQLHEQLCQWMNT